MNKIDEVPMPIVPAGNANNPFIIIANELGFDSKMLIRFFAGIKPEDWLTERVTPRTSKSNDYLGDFENIVPETDEYDRYVLFLGDKGAAALAQYYNKFLGGYECRSPRDMIRNCGCIVRLNFLGWPVPQWLAEMHKEPEAK